MRIKCAHIKNYKSISEEQKMYFSDRINVIIGKNESGKTNILDLFTDINLLTGLGANKIIKKNISYENEEFRVKIEIEYSSKEVRDLKLESATSYFTISDSFKNYCQIEGCISSYFNTDKFNELMKELSLLIEEIHNANKDTNSRKIIIDTKTYFNNFKSQTKPYYKQKLNNIDVFIKSNPNQKKVWDELRMDIEEYIEKIYGTLPRFHKFQNNELKTSYTMNADFFNKKTGWDPAIIQLINSTNIPLSDWEYASYKKPGTQNEYNAIERIRASIDNISNEFNEYFNIGSEITFRPSFSNSKFNLYTKSNEPYFVPFSERSQGLKWYFSLFIELKTLNLLDKNIMILIDEPGVYLHVNAQKEVLRMFDNFEINQTQILYTTHSPYMIDEDKIYRVIPVHKSNDGNTVISTSISSDNLDSTSKADTLTPLLEAMGMKLKHNIGFVNGYKYIVTEGITDASYLNAFITFLNNERYRAIPSKGASNVYLMCLLLYGFGFDDFFALFDRDAEGKRSADKVIKAFANELNGEISEEIKRKHIRYVSDKENVIEDLIEESMLQIDSVQVHKSEKVLFCNTFCRLLAEKPDGISNTTKSNFERLLNSLN